MNSQNEYEKRTNERRIIKEETRGTIIVGLAMLGSTILYGLAAWFFKFKAVMSEQQQERVWGMASLAVVILMIAILAIRKSIYYSPRLIKDDFTLTQVLRKWRTIDIVLLSVAEIIPLTGLVLRIMGISFDKTFHFFLGSALLMLILMPMGIKVRSKLSILRQQFPDL